MLQEMEEICIFYMKYKIGEYPNTIYIYTIVYVYCILIDITRDEENIYKYKNRSISQHLRVPQIFLGHYGQPSFLAYQHIQLHWCIWVGRGQC